MNALMTEPHESDEDFSLVLGGPLFQIFRRAYLSGSALELLHRRLIFITAISWFPLLVLSIWEGHAWGSDLSLPFLRDVDAQARFLVALPLLLAAELFVHRRMRDVARQFLDRGLIPDSHRSIFDKAAASATRLRNSMGAELLLVAFVYGVGVLFLWRKNAELNVASWYNPTLDGSIHPSLAGWWFALFSLPLFQFLLFRWYYRLFIWARFLWQVSRIKLDLVPTHPDRSAGLGFLSNVTYAFMPLMLAQGTLLAGMIANRLFYTGAHLTQFKVDIAGVVLLALAMVLAPLLVFSPHLERAKRAGRREYGTLAQRYVREFDRKWLRGGAAPDELLIGSSDIQSLADMGNSYEVVSEMTWFPFTTKTVLELGISAIAPLLPLALTMVPLDQLLDRLLKILF
jgi:hypothetical protein